MPPFHSKEFILPGSLGGQLHCFPAVLCPYSRPSHYTCISPYKLALPVFQTCTTLIHQPISLIQALAFISHIRAAFGFSSYAHVGAERQTYIYIHTNELTYIHTHTHTHFSENNSSKTGACTWFNNKCG